MQITAYTYDAAMHCPECTLRQFTIGRLALAHPCPNDEHGVPYDPYDLLDREGNEVRPVFITDEIDPCETCDDCGRAIE